MPHANKKGKEKFHACVKNCLKRGSVEHIRWFYARARRYMLTYSFLDSPESLEGHGLSYCEIEQYVDKKMKVHQSTTNQECSYISKVWQELQNKQWEYIYLIA